MQITNFNFYLFFFLVFCLYWIKPQQKWQNWVILMAGMVFYIWISPIGLAILLITTGLEYFLTQRMVQTSGKNKYFYLSIALNIFTLVIFKYFNFFVGPVAKAALGIGLVLDVNVLKLALPAGLSFYTLRRISYILDIQKTTIKPISKFHEYLLYVSYFPQLISGPIDRAGSLYPQLQKDRLWSFENFRSAWPLVISGLFKKIVIADNVSILVDKVFSLLVPTGSQLMVATFAFSIQILADFSAYTDLSRALSHLLGIQTPKNFDSPFLAVSPSDFWKRWHITLSEWLRDYIFFPIRRAFLRRSRGKNTWVSIILPPTVTMLISGIWHGAGFNYLIWGLYHGMLLALFQLLPGNHKPKATVLEVKQLKNARVAYL